MTPEVSESVGFTGTQLGMNESQKRDIRKLLERFQDKAKWFHHGDCIGADAEAAAIAKGLGFKLACHPPTNPKKRAFVPSDYTYPEAEYLDRNRGIVNSSFALLATPKENTEQLRSGTWATIRYARKVLCPTYIVRPEEFHDS